MSVKNNVETLKNKANLSTYELAKRCGFISSTNHVLGKYITNAEKGKITLETALRIYEELKKAGVCTRFEEVFWLDESDSQE